MPIMNDGGVVSSPEEETLENNSKPKETVINKLGDDVTLYGLAVHLMESIMDNNNNNNNNSSMGRRIKKAYGETSPMFRKATVNTKREVVEWTRGSPLRALLLLSAGIVTLLALAGMLVFMVVFIAATVNAIVISFLISLAAVGGFLAIFFACMTTMYIGLLFITAFVTFTVTISSIIAALVAAGWIGFIWMIWLAASKSARMVKRIAYAANASGQHNTRNF